MATEIEGVDDVKYISETIEGERIHAVVFHEGSREMECLLGGEAGTLESERCLSTFVILVRTLH